MTNSTPTTDRPLTVRQAADILGVPTAFVRGEIVDGRLHAAVEIRRPGGRTYRRIARADLLAYCRKWYPRAAQEMGR